MIPTQILDIQLNKAGDTVTAVEKKHREHVDCLLDHPDGRKLVSDRIWKCIEQRFGEVTYETLEQYWEEVWVTICDKYTNSENGD